MELAQALVGHPTGELGEPVVNRSEDPHHRGAVDHVVEVTNHEVGVRHVNVDRDRCQHHTGDASKHEVEQPAKTEQHRRGEADLASPERAKPGKHLHASGNGDQHGGDHEQIAHPLGNTTGEHVVNPHDQAQANDDERGQSHIQVAKERFTGIDRKKLREDSEHRQDDHIHRRMRIEPEEVLI